MSTANAVVNQHHGGHPKPQTPNPKPQYVCNRLSNNLSFFDFLIKKSKK